MKEYRKSLLISVAELKTNTIISGNVDDKFLLSAIMTWQEVHLEDLIGTALYHRIQELIYNTVKKQDDNINKPENEIYRTLLDEYIKPFLKSKCTVELLYIVSYKMKNAGMVKTSDTNVANADMDEIKYLERQHSVYVNSYSERISKFLKEHFDDIPELSIDTPLYYNDANINKDYASDCGLWLGGSKNNKCN